ncbi:MAG TPA: hypothetical protein VHF69_01725, partial [Candidatus Synoicihabitans sp.]|nr:hypothetical protein [Candidatus Synoicihabitans sp.]
MALWEYKVITSGKGGFATPQLLENFLNQLGKEEWEIVEFRTAPENFLAFTGLARRGVQRDWTLEAAAAAAAKAEAEQRKAEERVANQARDREGPATEPSAAPAEDPTLRDESFRRPRDTELDQDPEALADEASEEPGDWDEWSEEDELPTLFEAVRPHLRRNQKGPGQSVAIDYLAKRWEQNPDDIAGALVECGFTVPDTEDSQPDYFEFEGDLYWLNKNNRGQLFLNVREKPRPAFRVTPVKKLDPADPAAVELAAEHQAELDRKSEARRQQEAREAAQAAKAEAAQAARAARAAEATAAAQPAPMPEGVALLGALRPRMRQNRRGGGFSGSTAYLAKTLRHPEAELVAALAALGLKASDQPDDQAKPVEIAGALYWLNKDGRGGIWINGREKREGESGAVPTPPDGDTGEAPAAEGALEANLAQAAREADAPAGEAASSEATDEAAVPSTPAPAWLVELRTRLEPNRRGSGASAPVEDLARITQRPLIELVESLVTAGLSVPDTAKDKSTSLEVGDDVVWLSRSVKDDSLVLNAKPKG